MKLKVTYEVETKEGVAELLAATKHLNLRPWIDTVTTTDEEFVATPVKEDERIADKPGAATYEWLDCGVTFMQNYKREGYDVEVADNDGLIVKTHVFLYEWSGYVTPFINAKDATGLVEYLIELNNVERRDGTIIRDE